MSFALIFSGQGMQHAGMLPWLMHDETVQAVEQALGTDWRERLNDAAWAGCNAHAQLLLTGLGLAAWAQLAPLLPAPMAIAGYSVGELAAFAAAGVYDTPTALGLARQRAALMDQCALASPSGLLAVSGLAGVPLQQLCIDFDLSISIRNGVDSVVLGGRQDTLAAAAEAATAQGAHCTRLNVNVASHTPYMAGAAPGFAALISTMPFKAPTTLLFSNFSGRVLDAAGARQALAGQIDHTVRWDDCMESIAARRVRCVLEVGPGHALAHMWNQRHPQIPARSVDEFRSTQAIARWVGQMVA